MRIQQYVESLRRGLRRPEVRAHPVQAIMRRLAWRRHWRKTPSHPVLLPKWWRDLSIALPNTNNASLLFYRTHSDPNLALLLQALLSPGMTFVDVGAHIGEFTLIGATMVGSGGKVLAIEPLPPCAAAIRHNASINRLEHVRVFEGALCHYTGKIGFLSDPQRSGGWIAAKPEQTAFEAPCWTLSDFFQHAGIAKAHVIKLDASGNELSVLRGGKDTFSKNAVGRIVMKLYHPNVTQERFGYDAHESVSLLLKWGIPLRLMVGQEAFPVSRADQIDQHYDQTVYARTLVAG